MSSTTDFVAKLVRAANEVETLSAYDMAYLLEQSILTIRETRSSRGIRVAPNAKDPLRDVERAQSDIMRGMIVPDQVTAAFDQAATLIGDLHMTQARMAGSA